MSEAATQEAPAKKRDVIKVKMQDGRDVEFAGKRKVIKTVLEDGRAGCRFDFINGETREYLVPAHHMLYSAGHGFGQKIGDNFAGMKDDNGQPADIDDIVLASDELYEKLSAEGSSWNEATGGGGGVSLLIKALMEAKGQTVEKVKTFLASKTDDEKKALKLLPPIKAIITKLQDERDAKRTKDIDAGALLAELEGMDA